MRDSPSLGVAVRLHGLGANVIATDPEAIANSRRLNQQLAVADGTSDALAGADAVVVVAEWKEFRELDPAAVAELTNGLMVIDGRNGLDDVAWRGVQQGTRMDLSEYSDDRIPRTHSEMKLSVIGCGYLGAVHAASMAELGHDDAGIDVDAAKIEMPSQARAVL